MSDPQFIEGPPVQSPPEEEVQHVEPLPGIPVPPAIRLFFVVVAVSFVFALTRMPHAVSVGLSYERGHQAFEKGEMGKAAEQLAPVAKEFPKAKEVRMDLAEAYARSGQIPEAIRELNSFEGTMVNNKEDARLNSIADIVEQKIKEEGQ